MTIRLDYSNPLMLRLRRAAQRLGILRPMVGLYRRILGVAYEEKYDWAILECVASGDVIWDIGANVGFFTRKFANKVGETGKVMAFEPSPSAFDILRAKCGDLGNVELLKTALGDRDGTAQFCESGIEADPTNGLYNPGNPGNPGNVTEVTLCQGDTLCAQRPEVVPTHIKIDVEGYECEVLEGLSETLRSPVVRNVFVEVHFQVLTARGLTDAPAIISRVLKERGFELRWVDPSHLIAGRPS